MHYNYLLKNYLFETQKCMHLAGNNSIEISSPMYATAVGLVMNSTKAKRINEKETTENASGCAPGSKLEACL